MSFVPLLALITTVVGVYSAIQDGCSISMGGKFPKNEPLFISNKTAKYDLYFPKDGHICLRRGETMLLLCSNSRNYLEASNANLTSATCVGGRKFTVARNILSLENLECKRKVQGEVRETGRQCGSGNKEGDILEIGYRITKTEWITLIEVCYNVLSKNTLYSKHTLYGREIKHASNERYRPRFSIDASDPLNPAPKVYKKGYQKSTFSRLLSSSILADKFISKTFYLARGHLSPDADFLFAAWQFTTYFYVNAVPQWQVINGGNWVIAESLVRRTSDYLQEELLIITGTHDILSLPDINGNFVDIYLEENIFPVPKYIWKVVYSETMEKGIVLIVLNNPFVENNSENLFLCPNICKEYKWYTRHFSNSTKGLLHCCDVRDFENVVKTVPKLKIVGVLEGIKRKTN